MKNFCKVLCILACFMMIASTSFAASILVTWTANAAGEGVTGYNVFDKVGTGVVTKVGTVTATASPSFTIANVADGLHTVTVTAFDADGNESLPSDPATATVDTIAPSKPGKPTLTISK